MAWNVLNFPKDRGGPNWLTIEVGMLPGSDWKLTIAAHEPIVVPGGANQLNKQPFEFASPDGSGTIRIEVPDMNSWRTPVVRLDGKHLPGSAGSPEGKIFLAFGWAAGWCVLALIAGLIATFDDRQYGAYNPLSWNVVAIAGLVGVLMMRSHRAAGIYPLLGAMALDFLVGLLWVLALDAQSDMDAAVIWITVLLDLGLRVFVWKQCLDWRKSCAELGLIR